MGRIFAIGDIHGHAAALCGILDRIGPQAGDTLVFLGDYIDRGPSSREVIDQLVGLRAIPGVRAVFLKGNHEDTFLAWLGEPGGNPEGFLGNGGAATLASYGIDAATRGRRARELIPGQHLAFLRSLSLTHIEGRFLFVHGGLDPADALTEQKPAVVVWIRQAFYDEPHPFPYTVVFGHTPTQHMEREGVVRGRIRAGVFFDLPFKIGLDSGCAYGEKLSCLELTSGTLYQAGAKLRRVLVRTDLPEARTIADLAAGLVPAQRRSPARGVHRLGGISERADLLPGEHLRQPGLLVADSRDVSPRVGIPIRVERRCEDGDPARKTTIRGRRAAPSAR